MRTVITITGLPLSATSARTNDDQSRKDNGQFGSGSGGGHIQKHVPRENESRAERADIARASGSHGTAKEKFSKSDHKNSSESHSQQAEKHEKRGDKRGALLHRQAAAAHKTASSSGESSAAHKASKAANAHSDSMIKRR